MGANTVAAAVLPDAQTAQASLEERDRLAEGNGEEQQAAGATAAIGPVDQAHDLGGCGAAGGDGVLEQRGRVRDFGIEVVYKSGEGTEAGARVGRTVAAEVAEGKYPAAVMYGDVLRLWLWPYASLPCGSR